MKVYRYACHVTRQYPLAGADALDRQLRLRAEMWAALADAHRGYAERRRSILDTASAEIAGLSERRDYLTWRIDTLREGIREQRRRSRSAHVPVDGARREILALAAERREVREQINAARADAAELRPALRAVDEEERAQTKVIRQRFAARGLHWGTYNDAIQGFDAAKGRRGPDGRPVELRSRPYAGTGTVCVQIPHESGQPALTVADVLAGRSQQVQIDPVPIPRSTRDPHRDSPGRLHLARIRVGSDERRRPVWVEVPIVYHRPMPDDARVLMARLTRTRLAGHWRYHLCVTVEESLPIPRREGGVVAVHVGWRRLPDGEVRAGYWVDEHGAGGELRLHPRIERATDHAEGLERTRAHNALRCACQIGALLGCDTGWRPWVPAWLRLATLHVRHRPTPRSRPDYVDDDGWGSTWHGSSLRRLHALWSGRRVDGDQDAWAILDDWRRQDRHLQEWAAHERMHAQDAREYDWRIIARDLSREYALAVVGRMTLPDVQRRKGPEHETHHESTAQRHLARIVAPGELLSEVKRAMAASGGALLEADSADITRVHAACGTRVEADFAASHRVWCPTCTIEFDQDANACANLLARGRDGASERPMPDTPPSLAVPRGRFQRAKLAAQMKRANGGADAAGAAM